MTWKRYLACKAIGLCFFAIAALLWGAFAFLTGAQPLLLWGSEGIFFCAVLLWLFFGYRSARKRIEKLERLAAGISPLYLLGETLPKPRDAAEAEYFHIMKEVSRSAIGTAESALQEKEEYCDYVESWIHEIKTPLTACSLILANGGDETKLRRELKRADNLTETILYYARLRSPERDTVISESHAFEILGEALKSQRELLTAAKIRVEAEGDFLVYTDRKAVCFILKQLLINCAKYCRGCRVSLTAKEGEIIVEDDGPGIPAHELPRVTQRGFTGGNGRAGSGTGMGLYIVSELCRRLEIGLNISSRGGEGTKFVLVFEGWKESLTKT